MPKKQKQKQFWTDFKSFISRGNVVDLAVAMVVGAAFNKIVSQLVDSFINPLIGIFVGGFDLADLKYVVHEAVTDEAGNAKAVWSIADNATLYAKWNVVNYKITYVLNGGQNHSNNPATYNIEDANITLNYPTKSGYTFNGWVLQDASFAQKDITITAGSTGDRLYAASWVRSSQFVAISNANDLKNIANNPNGYYYLTADIDMSGVEWKAISEFNGILDGNGHTISNITYASNESLIYCNNGTILNLHINTSKIIL